MANEIKLTFAGDTAPLESSFSRVGTASRTMSEDVGRANRSIEESSDRAASSSSQLSGGIGDIGGSLAAAFGDDSAIGKFGAQLEMVSAVTMGLVGVADLANLSTKGWAAAQRVLNLAWLTSPITWIVLGVGLLIAAIVLIATKTDWFSKIWNAAWGWIKRTASSVWDWLKALPGKIGDAFGKVGNLITSPFKSAFNAVAKAWNNTIGQLSWTVPGWVPFVGGNSISAPRLPTFHQGGHASGAMGQEFLAVLRAGERVTATSGSGGGSVVTVQASGNGTSAEQLLAELIAALIRKGALILVIRDGKVAVSHA